jgi:hypothetical protein
MPVFPTTESEIQSLARQMLGGYELHPADFPHVNRIHLQMVTMIYMAAARQQQKWLAIEKKKRAARVRSLAELKRVMKECLKKSQVDVAAQPLKLRLIGWGPRRLPESLAGPGCPGSLQLCADGPGTVTLHWRKPISGGAVGSYRIERSTQQTGSRPGAWTLIAAAYDETITLKDQPRGGELHYRVLAANAAGMSRPGNIAVVAL